MVLDSAQPCDEQDSLGGDDGARTNHTVHSVEAFYFSSKNYYIFLRGTVPRSMYGLTAR
jgi:hypothetical protein